MRNIDKKTIYQNLRQEAMDLVKRQDTYLLAAYTLTITVWTFAIQFKNSWSILLLIFILLPLSLSVCEFRNSIAFLSSFMAIFLEKESYDGWSFVREEYFETFNKKNGFLDIKISILSRTSFCLLTIISVILFWVLTELDFSTVKSIVFSCLTIIVQIFVVFIQFKTWYKYADTTQKKKEYMKNWRTLYNKIYGDENKNS